jgi:polyhydroxyalkanoate synthesis regulator phasin
MTNEDTLDSTHDSATPAGKRRGIAIGIAGGLLAGTAAGLVFGVPGLTSAASTDVSVSQAALVQQTDETDTTSEDAPAEMGTRLRESLEALVDDGTITAEQADAIAAHLVENRPERGESGDGHGPGGHRGGPGMFGRGVASEALTDLLGIDGEELRTQLRDGATLAEIAEEQGVEVQAVVDELVAEVTERVDNAVENGRIDQAEADEKLAEAEAKITDMVNNGRPERGTTDTED